MLLWTIERALFKRAPQLRSSHRNSDPLLECISRPIARGTDAFVRSVTTLSASTSFAKRSCNCRSSASCVALRPGKVMKTTARPGLRSSRISEKVACFSVSAPTTMPGSRNTISVPSRVLRFRIPHAPRSTRARRSQFCSEVAARVSAVRFPKRCAVVLLPHWAPNEPQGAAARLSSAMAYS